MMRVLVIGTLLVSSTLISITVASSAHSQRMSVAASLKNITSSSHKFEGMLNPDDPLSYLQVGELLLFEEDRDENKEFAKQVLAVGAGLASLAGNRELASSMCLLLSTFETDQSLIEYLRDCALILDPINREVWMRLQSSIPTDQEHLKEQAAMYLHSVRHAQLNDYDTQTLQRMNEIVHQSSIAVGLNPDQVFKLLQELRSKAESDSCDGSDFVRQRVGSEVHITICSAHHRPVGLMANDQALADLLILESYLLQSTRNQNTSWASDSVSHSPKSFRLPSIEGVLRQYNVSIQRPILRNGEWTK